eukprot:350554-Chlamydomonas_euryale.AAC.7
MLAGEGRFLGSTVSTAAADLCPQLRQRACLDRHPERHHLVQHAPQRPVVAAVAVQLAAPNLGRHVHRCADLSLGKVRLLKSLRDAQVAYFEHVALAHEDVGRLEIAVHNVGCVDGDQALAQLQEDAPDGLLWKGRVEPLPLADVILEVAVWRVLHHSAQLIATQEGFIVADLCGIRWERWRGEGTGWKDEDRGWRAEGKSWQGENGRGAEDAEEKLVGAYPSGRSTTQQCINVLIGPSSEPLITIDVTSSCVVVSTFGGTVPECCLLYPYDC